MMMNRFAAVALALGVVAGGAWVYTSQTAPSQSAIVQTAGAQEASESADSSDIELVPDMTQGAADAPVEVIEYASFTCPHCARFHTGPYERLKENYIETDKIRFTLREVYFDRIGLWAAVLARCGGPDRYFGITKLLFEQQSEWAQQDGPEAIAAALRKIGLQAGLDGEQIDACFSDGDKARSMFATYQHHAEADQIDATPSFVIDGEKHGNMSYEEFSGILDEKLEE